eukprot:gene5581-7569_t
MDTPPGSVDTLHCDQHGEAAPTYTCGHLCRDPVQRWFCDAPSPDTPFPDAWCASCHAEWIAQIAEELRHELVKVDNVGTSGIVGGAANQIRVEPDPEKLSLYGITLGQLIDKLTQANRSFQLSHASLSACRIRASPLVRISSDCAARMPVIAREWPSSFFSALRSPPERGVG